MSVNSRRIQIYLIPFLIFISAYSVRGQDSAHPLMGRWTGQDTWGTTQTFIFDGEQNARWIVGSDRETETLEIQYDIDYETVPHPIKISGIVSGPLKDRVLYGILGFRGSDIFRMDLEPGAPGSTNVRPVSFSEQSVTYSRVLPVKHVVLIWLKEPGDRKARQKLIETSKSFEQIPGVISVSAGTPLESDRPVVDDSFDVAVVITFESREAMQNYETHPLHADAVEKVLRPLTDRMVIYDFEDR